MLKLADMAARPDFQRGNLLISPSRRQVRGPAGKVHLQPRIMQVFLLLLDGDGRVVTRNEIFDNCWGGLMVGDDSLNRAIAGVRRIAAEVAPGAFEVETIPRTGYRLIGLAPDPAEPAEALLSDGRQGGRGGLSRRSVVAASAAAAAAGGLGLWAALRPRSDARFTGLVEQADRVLRHEYPEGRQSVISLLEQALAIRPGDPAALGLLAYARALSATGAELGGANKVPAAERAIKDALAADRNDPHARLALLLFRGDEFEWATTEDELRAVLAAAPQNALALGWLIALYQAAGRLQLSWNVNEALIGIDPISPPPQYRRALKLWIFGRTGDAYRLIERLIRIWPRHPFVWNARFIIFAFTGRAHAALDMIDDSEARPATITPARMAQWRPTLAALETRNLRSISAAREANLASARESPGQAAYAVMALSAIGEIDAAYEVAEGFLLSRGKIITRRPTDRHNMLVNNPTWRRTQWLSTPPLAGFRADRRFSALCDGIGLTAYWRLRGIKPDYPNVRMA